MSALRSVTRARRRILAVFAFVYILGAAYAPDEVWAQTLSPYFKKEIQASPSVPAIAQPSPVTIPVAEAPKPLAPEFENPPEEDEHRLPPSAAPPPEIGSPEAGVVDVDSISPPTLSDGKIQYSERPDDQQLIVELLVDDDVLDSGVVVYLLDEDILVPLSVFTELLGFPIKVDTAKGMAEGWFIRPENTFSLLYPFDRITLGGTSSEVKNGIVELHLDDIYVSTTLISEWFPIGLSFNYNELRLYMTAREDLPFQQRAKRRARWETSKINQTKPGGIITGPVIKLPYRTFSLPSVQVNHSATTSGGNGADFNNNTNHSFQFQNDLLKMDARTGFNFSTGPAGNKLQNFNFNLSRNSYDNKMLGKLQATEISIGDVSAHTFPLTGGTSQGRGATLSNHPFNYIRDINKFVIEGIGPVGWDVEVYQDQRLLDFQTVGETGEYSFQTLSLREGFNLFQIILYGPNGEREERTERFFLGKNMVDPGQFIYEFNALQSSTPLLDLDGDTADATPSTISFLGEYGINQNVSAFAGLYTGPAADTRLSGLGAGLRVSSERTYSQLDFFQNKDGAASSSLTVTGNVNKNITLTGNYTSHRNYEADIHGTLRSSTLEYSHNIAFSDSHSLALSLSAQKENGDNGEKTWTYKNRLSTSFFGINASNELEYITYNTSADPDLNGKLTLRYRSPVGTLRGRLNYRMIGDPGLESSELQLQSDLSKTLTLNTTLLNQYTDGISSTLDMSLDWKLDKVRLGLTGSYADTGAMRAGVNLSYVIVPRSLSGDYEISGLGSDLSTGRVLVKPFLDKNQNGTWEEDEPLLGEGIAFKNLMRGTEGLTDKNSTALVRGLANNVPNRIVIQSKTLPDIYLNPVSEGINIVGKPGVNGPIYFPIAQLGEVSGTLTALGPDGEEITLPDVRILLLDANEKVVAETHSESDGYYGFPSLPMGEYQMFFPSSDNLNSYYQGDGEGPSFVLENDQPEREGMDILTLPERIMFKEEYQNSRPLLMKDIKFFALSLKELATGK